MASELSGHWSAPLAEDPYEPPRWSKLSPPAWTTDLAKTCRNLPSLLSWPLMVSLPRDHRLSPAASLRLIGLSFCCIVGSRLAAILSMRSSLVSQPPCETVEKAGYSSVSTDWIGRTKWRESVASIVHSPSWRDDAWVVNRLRELSSYERIF